MRALLQVQHNKLLGVIGEHDGYPVEHIDVSHDHAYLRYAASAI